MSSTAFRSGVGRWIKCAGVISAALCVLFGTITEAAPSAGKLRSALRGSLLALGNGASVPMPQVNGSAGGYEGDVNEASTGDSATGSAANLFSSGGPSGAEQMLPLIAPSKLPLEGMEQSL